MHSCKRYTAKRKRWRSTCARRIKKLPHSCRESPPRQAVLGDGLCSNRHPTHARTRTPHTAHNSDACSRCPQFVAHPHPLLLNSCTPLPPQRDIHMHCTLARPASTRTPHTKASGSLAMPILRLTMGALCLACFALDRPAQSKVRGGPSAPAHGKHSASPGVSPSSHTQQLQGTAASTV